MTLLIQAGGGILMIFFGAVALIGGLEEFGIPGRSDGFDGSFFGFLGVTIRELVIGKLVGLFVVTSLIEVFSFMTKRRSHVKPAKENIVAREKWNEPKVTLCGLRKNAPCSLWDRFIGADNEMEHLPSLAQIGRANV